MFKKLFSLLFLLACLSTGVFAQNTSANSVAFTPYAVGTLPPASSNNGRTFRITDGTTGTDCTTGGGSGTVFCTSNGTTYISTPYTVGTGAVVAAAQYSLGCYLSSGTVASVSGCLNIATDSSGDLIVSSSGAALTQTEIADPGAPGTSKGSLYENNAYHRWMKYDNNSGPLAIGTWNITTAGGLNVGAQTAINGIYTESACAGNTTTPGFFTEDASGNCSWTAITSITNVVYTNQSNVFTSSGALNLGLATSFIVPKSASAIAVASGQIVFDTTANSYHGFVGGADAQFAAEAAAIANNIIPKSCNSNTALLCASGMSDSGTAISVGTESFSAGASNLTTINTCNDTSGSGTAQVCSTSVSFTPTSGSCITYSTTTQNSGTGLTVNVNSLGAKSVAKWLGTTTLAAGDVPAGQAVLMCYSGTVWNLTTIGNAPSGGGTLAESSLTGSTAQTTITETGIGHEITRAGVETANLTYPYVIQNTNTTTNTSGALGINTAGVGGTGQVPLIVNETVAAGDFADFYTLGTFTNGVFSTSGSTKVASIAANGTLTTNGNLIFSGSASPTISTTTSNQSLTIAPNGTGPVIFNAGTATNPTQQAAGSASNTGDVFATTAHLWSSAGTAIAGWDANGQVVGDGKAYIFSQSATANGTVGAELSIVGTGSTEAMTTNGGTSTNLLLLPGNGCKITGPVTLSGTTAVVCSWTTLPNSAQTWAWQCHGSYNITGGTTPGLTLQMNASQAPTSETGNAVVGSLTASGAVTQTFQTGSSTSTSSGVQTIFADSPTVAITTVTNAPWETSGTIQASATSGTFAIQAVLSGTGTPAGAINAGSTCLLY